MVKQFLNENSIILKYKPIFFFFYEVRRMTVIFNVMFTFALTKQNKATIWKTPEKG